MLHVKSKCKKQTKQVWVRDNPEDNMKQKKKQKKIFKQTLVVLTWTSHSSRLRAIFSCRGFLTAFHERSPDKI